MKRILIVIVAFFLSFQMKGQKNNQLNEIITASINSHIAWKNDFVKRGIIQNDTCLNYFCKEGLPTGFPYDNMKNIVFFSLENLDGLPKSFKKELKKGVDACFIWINLTNNQLVITVRDQGVKLMKKSHIEIRASDWSIFTYEYSCEKQKWLLIETKNGGV